LKREEDLIIKFATANINLYKIMSKDIKVRKGLDLRLKGEAEKTISNAPKSKTFAIKPSEFHLVVPKMVVKEGAKVKVGDPIFYSKANKEVKIVSPVSGTLTTIERGAKRVILSIIIEADAQQEVRDLGSLNVESSDAETLKARLLEGGCWPFIMQRPYDVIAEPETAPRDIFISGFSSAPLAPDYDFVLNGKEKELQVALTALSKMTAGKVHVGVRDKNTSVFSSLKNIELHSVEGPHPAGNVGTQIAMIAPVNKGETIWTINAQNLVTIGTLLLTGKFNPERTIAVAGSSVKSPKYYRTELGGNLSGIINDAGLNEDHVRVISGDVLTGKKEAKDGFLGYNANMVTVIPEGDDYEFFGWNKPIFNKVSTSRALTFSWLTPNKKYELDTNTNGEHRAFVLTGNYEEVFPLDIYPLQTLKACMVQDLDQMEALGMYEVAPEDFALTEFICVSKQPHQEIIRKGLDLMYKEIG